MKILHKDDICEMFGYAPKKMKQLFETGVLPITKIGNDYVTTEEEMAKFFAKWKGKEIDL